MQVIGNYFVQDSAAFNIKLYANYQKAPNTPWYRAGSFKELMVGQSYTFDPGSEGTINTGFPVQLYIDVVGGKDLQANEIFEYVSGNTTTANYVVTGNLFSRHLKFLGTTSSAGETEKLIAEHKESEAMSHA